MDLGLAGKVVLITGSSKGIGFACAKAFAAEDAKVSIVSRDPANLARAREQLASDSHHVHLTRADLHEAHSVENVVEEASAALGPIDILINSAGAVRRYDPNSLDAAAYKAAMDAKYFSYVYPQQVVLKRMAERLKRDPNAEPGAIVNIIGMGGKIASDIHIADGAANAALMLNTVGLAHHYAKLGIRINAINPGSDADRTRRRSAGARSAKRRRHARSGARRRSAKSAVRRFAKPEEIADGALFLASRRASYVSGGLIPMDRVSSPII